MKDWKEMDIKIYAQFGSKFQEKLVTESLYGVLKAWQHFVNTTHKQNAIDVDINGDQLISLDWISFEKAKS